MVVGLGCLDPDLTVGLLTGIAVVEVAEFGLNCVELHSSMVMLHLLHACHAMDKLPGRDDGPWYGCIVIRRVVGRSLLGDVGGTSL